MTAPGPDGNKGVSLVGRSLMEIAVKATESERKMGEGEMGERALTMHLPVRVNESAIRALLTVGASQIFACSQLAQ